MESTSLIRVVENQCNNTVKFVFKRMPFCSNEEDVVEFTCHRKKNGDYYVMMLPFLGVDFCEKAYFFSSGTIYGK